MQSEAFEEAVQGVRAAVCEVRPESVATDVFHFVLVWERGDGALGVFAAEEFVEEDKVRKASADFNGGLLEGCKIGLFTVY